MKVSTAEWLISKIDTYFDEGCEICVRMKDGHIISYFYNTKRHTYHRGLREVHVDHNNGLLIAESDYGLTGVDCIADFIDIDSIAMISLIQSEKHEAATL